MIRLGLAILVIMLLFMMFLPDQSWITYRGGMWFFSFLSMLFIALIVHPDLPFDRWFSNPITDYLGKRSYGIYLWQMPLLAFLELKLPNPKSFVSICIQLVIILLVSEMSYCLVEMPLRNLSMIQVKNWLRSLFAKNWSMTKLARLGRLFVVLVALGIIFTAPVKTATQEKIATEIAENQKMLQAKEATKIQKAEKLEEVMDEGLRQELAQKYGVSEEVVEASYQTKVLMVGDSIMTKTYPQLAEAFPYSYIDAEFGLAPENAFSKVQAGLTAYPQADRVLISLGTNQGGQGIMTRQQVQDIMSLLSDKQVYWVTINLPASTYWWTDEINTLLAEEAENYPNLTLIDWYGKSSPHALEWFEADGFHPNADGSIAYVSMLMESLTKDRLVEKEE